MADQRRPVSDDPLFNDNPNQEAEEIRDETDEDDEFEDAEELEEEEDDDVDLGKNVRDQERGTADSRAFTSEIGSEGGSAGETEVEREFGRRLNAGEATTTGGQAADEIRFDHRRDEE